MRFDALDFPQLRTAPEGVVRELEGIDPALGLLHSRGNRWLLCEYQPDHVNVATAIKGLAHWRNLVSNGMAYSRESYVRIRQYQLALRGWKQIAVYVVTHDDFGFVVSDAKAARWMRNHTTENELFAEIDRAEYDRRESARAEVASLDRAKDAYNHAFKLYHTTSVSLTPKDKPRSGFVRHAIAS